MDRIEKLRESRDAPQVVFVDYLKVRELAKTDIVLIFEGKECPVFYLSKINQLLSGYTFHQLIARGKKNVLNFRNLVQRNINTRDDKNLYFVDKDYDDSPASGDSDDLYVTRGYSIENELINWNIIQSFIKANFDIADFDDMNAMSGIKDLFEKYINLYLLKSKQVHQVVYFCRKSNINCTPGGDIYPLLSFDFTNEIFSTQYASIDDLLYKLKIDFKDHANVKANYISFKGFDELDEKLCWRGKYHYSFLRKFIIHLHFLRTQGKLPFIRKSKISIDPNHPSLLSLISIFALPPNCLRLFLNKYIQIQTGKLI
jgi:Protein of unknown function (DUF4435)